MSIPTASIDSFTDELKKIAVSEDWIRKMTAGAREGRVDPGRINSFRDRVHAGDDSVSARGNLKRYSANINASSGGGPIHDAMRASIRRHLDKTPYPAPLMPAQSDFNAGDFGRPHLDRPQLDLIPGATFKLPKPGMSLGKKIGIGAGITAAAATGSYLLKRHLDKKQQGAEKIAGVGQLISEGWNSQGGWPWKALSAVGTGLAARRIMQDPQDPAGQGRSRFERTVGLIGNTAGGLAGTGLAMRMAPKSRFLAPLIGGIAGSMAGETATPMLMEKRRLAKQLAEERAYNTTPVSYAAIQHQRPENYLGGQAP